MSEHIQEDHASVLQSMLMYMPPVSVPDTACDHRSYHTEFVAFSPPYSSSNLDLIKTGILFERADVWKQPNFYRFC